MNYKLDESSLLLTARHCTPTSQSLVVTVGFLIDSNSGRALPATESWKWIGSNFVDEAFDRGLKKSVGTFAVLGHAFALSEQQSEGMAVRVQLGSCEKTLHVFPPRTWRQGFTGWTADTVGRLNSVAIDFEQAFGGIGDASNPNGKGYYVDLERGEGGALPQVEHPAFPLLSPIDRPPLASFLPMSPQCKERTVFIGTLDEHWQTHHAPWLPADTDLRWFNEVAEDQCQAHYWQGDESWSVTGMHSRKAQITGALPGLRPRLFIELTSSPLDIAEVALDLDTVWLFPNDEYQLLLYRAEVAVTEVDGEDIAAIGVACETRTDPVLSATQWIDRLWPRALAEPVRMESTPVPPVDTDSALRTLQADADRIYNEILKIHQTTIEMAKKLTARVGQTFDPLKYPPPERPDFVALVKLGSTAPTARFDPAALEADIRASITNAEARANQYAEQIAKRLNRNGQSLNAHLAAAKASNPHAKLDAASMVARLPVSDAQKADYQARIEEAVATAKSVDTKITNAVAAMMEQIAAGSAQLLEPALLASPTVWTRELIEAAYASAQPLKKQHFIGLDLSGIDLSRAELAGTHFETCQLLLANLSGAQLQSCLFTDSDLSGVDLHDTQLHTAVFQRCRLDDGRFAGARLEALYATGCSLLRAQLAQAYLPQAQFVDCVLSQSDLSGAELTGASFQDCSLDAVQAVDAHMSRSRFHACTLTQMQLSGTDLHGASWSQVIGSGVNAKAANLQNFRLDQNCQLPGICLDQADMSCAGLNRSQLRGASLRETCLHKALINCCDLRDSDGHHLDAREANFTGSDLSECRWPGANLMEARLRKVDLDKADLSGSNLFGAVTEAVKGQDVQLARALLGRCRLKEDLAHV